MILGRESVSDCLLERGNSFVKFTAKPMGNRSFIFRRDADSWHGVKSLECPADALRKVFIVEFRKASLLNRARTAFGL